MRKLCFNDIISRRRFLSGSLAFGLSSFVTSTRGSVSKRNQPQNSINFVSVESNSSDTVTVPIGFEWSVVASWGDPMWTKAPNFNSKTRGTGESQELSIGDNIDGMAFFEIEGRSILVVNNEYCNFKVIYGNRPLGLPQSLDDLRKGMAAHGVSIFEIERTGRYWKVIKDSFYNRRITPATEMEITGPAAGHRLLQTAFDPSGRKVLGTLNNCGNGSTPWGTYLTCEENFNKYFYTQDQNFNSSLEQNRYGISSTNSGYGWASLQERFDLGKHPNEVNRFGYIVEIDPTNPESIPKKRTALGRFKHENCAVTVCKNKKVVIYMGDDEHGEFLYKFVSKNSLSTNKKDNMNLLEDGDLYAAIFEETGKGYWVNLLDAGMGPAQTLIYSRLAASKVGATTMDRPEWVSLNPHTPELYCCLTNNKFRGRRQGQKVNAVNPRRENVYGQIIRWRPDNNDHAFSQFTWDHFLFAGNPLVHDDEYSGSDNINSDNMFNSPDGLSFDSQGNLWIQTDGDYSNTGNFKGMGNNQMLMADPNSGLVKRFLVGPNECEVTGITWSSDKSTMFVGIQHPGDKHPEKYSFPNEAEGVPRSSVIAIYRTDRGMMG